MTQGYSLQHIVSLLDGPMGMPTHIIIDYKTLPTASFLQPEDSFLHKMIEDDDKASMISRPRSPSARDYQVSVNLGNSRMDKLSDVHGFYNFLLNNSSAVALSRDDYFSTIEGANYWSHGKALAQISFSEFKWVGSAHEISLQRNPTNQDEPYTLFIKYNPLAHKRNIPDLLARLEGSHLNHTIAKVFSLGTSS